MLQIYFFVYELLGSGLSPQSCLYFQGFPESKLLNGCLAVWSSNLCLQGKQWFLGFKIEKMISDFKTFPIMLLSMEIYLHVLRQPNVDAFNNHFTFATKEKLRFSLIFSFYCSLVKEGWAMKVAYQFAFWGLVAYKKTK